MIRVVLALVLCVPFGKALGSEIFVTSETGSEMFSERALHAAAAAVVADSASDAVPAGNAKRYWMTYAWLTAATIYDVESTFYLLGRCDECRETNPISRPFIDRGRLATYAYSFAVNAAVMYIARRMLQRGDHFWRLAPVALTAVHAGAGTWNVYQSASPPD